jgi:hypothetical protein
LQGFSAAIHKRKLFATPLVAKHTVSRLTRYTSYQQKLSSEERHKA